MKKFIAPTLLSFLICACGPAKNSYEAPGSGANTGSVGGIDFVVHSAASKAADGNNGFRLILSNAADYCSASTNNQLPKSHVTFSATLTGKIISAGQTQIVPGTYTMLYDGPPSDNGFWATGNFDASDDQCQPRLDDTLTEARSGTVTLTDVSAQGVTGTYKVVFEGGTLEGSFTAPNCPSSDMVAGKLCTL